MKAISAACPLLTSQTIIHMAVSTMYPAQYVCTGSPDVVLRHYALAVDLYTHFTSPIRRCVGFDTEAVRKCNVRDRYPDIIVHRLLQAALLKDGDLLAAGGCLEPADLRARSDALSGLQECAGVRELGVVAQHCNVMKKEAKSAGEDQGKVYLYVYLQTPKEYACVIKGIADDHFVVYMPDLGMEATVLKGDFNVAVSCVKPSTVELNAVQVRLHTARACDI